MEPRSNKPDSKKGSVTEDLDRLAELLQNMPEDRREKFFDWLDEQAENEGVDDESD